MSLSKGIRKLLYITLSFSIPSSFSMDNYVSDIDRNVKEIQELINQVIENNNKQKEDIQQLIQESKTITNNFINLTKEISNSCNLLIKDISTLKEIIENNPQLLEDNINIQVEETKVEEPREEPNVEETKVEETREETKKEIKEETKKEIKIEDTKNEGQYNKEEPKKEDSKKEEPKNKDQKKEKIKTEEPKRVLSVEDIKNELSNYGFTEEQYLEISKHMTKLEIKDIGEVKEILAVWKERNFDNAEIVKVLEVMSNLKIRDAESIKRILEKIDSYKGNLHRKFNVNRIYKLENSQVIYMLDFIFQLGEKGAKEILKQWDSLSSMYPDINKSSRMIPILRNISETGVIGYERLMQVLNMIEGLCYENIVAGLLYMKNLKTDLIKVIPTVFALHTAILPEWKGKNHNGFIPTALYYMAQLREEGYEVVNTAQLREEGYKVVSRLIYELRDKEKLDIDQIVAVLYYMGQLQIKFQDYQEKVQPILNTFNSNQFNNALIASTLEYMGNLKIEDPQKVVNIVKELKEKLKDDNLIVAALYHMSYFGIEDNPNTIIEIVQAIKDYQINDDAKISDIVYYLTSLQIREKEDVIKILNKFVDYKFSNDQIVKTLKYMSKLEIKGQNVIEILKTFNDYDYEFSNDQIVEALKYMSHLVIKGQEVIEILNSFKSYEFDSDQIVDALYCLSDLEIKGHDLIIKILDLLFTTSCDSTIVVDSLKYMRVFKITDPQEVITLVKDKLKPKFGNELIASALYYMWRPGIKDDSNAIIGIVEAIKRHGINNEDNISYIVDYLTDLQIRDVKQVQGILDKFGNYKFSNDQIVNTLKYMSDLEIEGAKNVLKILDRAKEVKLTPAQLIEQLKKLVQAEEVAGIDTVLDSLQAPAI